MNEKTDGVFNTTLTRDYLCAQCWGRVVEKCTDGEWIVACPKGCQPGGFVSQSWVEYKRHQDFIDLDDVQKNYPNLERNS